MIGLDFLFCTYYRRWCYTVALTEREENWSRSQGSQVQDPAQPLTYYKGISPSFCIFTYKMVNMKNNILPIYLQNLLWWSNETTLQDYHVNWRVRYYCEVWTVLGRISLFFCVPDFFFEFFFLSYLISSL